MSARSIAARPFALLWALFVSAGAWAADGDLDARFGGTGQVALPRGIATGLRHVPTGGIDRVDEQRFQLVMRDAGNDDLHVYRMHLDGQRDAGFGSAGDGYVRVSDCLGIGRSRIATDATQGALVWTGACLIRLASDGSRDASYGASGVVHLAVGTNAVMRLDDAGRAVLVGADGGQACVATRVLPDGAIDTAFGAAGWVHIAQCQPGTLTLRSGGRLLIGDRTQIIALDATGQPDASFGVAGRVNVAMPAGLTSMSIDTLGTDWRDGVWAAGVGRTPSGGGSVVVAYLDAAGGVVPTFGVRSYAMAPNASLNAFAETEMVLTVLPTKEVLMAFTLSAPVNSGRRTDFALLRLRADASADTDFAPFGTRAYDMPDLSGQGRHAAYDQLHGALLVPGMALLLGRTMFEDVTGSSDDSQPISLMRIGFDRLFVDDFQSR